MLLCNEIKRLEESDLVFLDSKLPLDIRDRFEWRTFKTWDKWRCNSMHALLHRQDVELHMTDPQSPTKPTFPFLLRLLSLTEKTDREHDGPMTGPTLEDLESAVFEKYQGLPEYLHRRSRARRHVEVRTTDRMVRRKHGAGGASLSPLTLATLFGRLTKIKSCN